MSLQRILSTLSLSFSMELEDWSDSFFHFYQTNRWFRLLIRLILLTGPAYFLLRRFYYYYFLKYQGKDFSSTSQNFSEKDSGNSNGNGNSKGNDIINKRYDFIVIGAGSAGCVIASRLALSSSSPQVLLIEAGGSDDTLYTKIPAAAVKLQLSQQDWAYQTVPQQNSQKSMINQKSNWPRGKCLGGCSSINYMLWVRGEKEDFNEWVKKGAIGWGWKDLLPYFIKCENISTTSLPRSKERGMNGPIWIEQLKSPNPATDAFIEATKQLNIPYIDDYNQLDYTGLSLCQYSTRKGQRWNTASAYLLPAINQPNLQILTHTHVQKIIFNHKKEAIGVIVRSGKTIEELHAANDITIYAAKEIILSAGAISSPHLLMLSGIGPSSHLSQFNIPVLVDSPGVGNNLQDHLLVPLIYKSLIPTLSNASESIRNLVELFWSGTGELCSPMVEAFVFLHSGVRDLIAGKRKLCDVQIHFAQGTPAEDHLKAQNVRPELAKRFLSEIEKSGGYTTILLPTLIRPTSRGTIRLNSADPFSPPLIDPNYLSTKHDIDTLIYACKVAERISHQEEMKLINGDQPVLLTPLLFNSKFNKETQSNEWWEEYIRNLALTIYHPTSTCAMGSSTDPMSVVTPDLFVKGVNCLRIIDASIFPDITSGNTNAPVIAIAEKGAEMILKFHFRN